jgi:hypothetical protein
MGVRLLGGLIGGLIDCMAMTLFVCLSVVITCLIWY